jgi:hypothetical protein
MSPRWKISRRTALKGIGAAISLPLLEAMGWAETPKKGAPRAPVRMGFVYVPNGVVVDQWIPTAADLSPILQTMGKITQNVLVITGLSNKIAFADPTKGEGGGHARPTAAFLTCTIPYRTGAVNKVGISVDQFAAQRIGHLTNLPSLELGTAAGQIGSDCDTGFNCSYTSNISWRGPNTPMAKEIKPKAAFARLFTDAKQGMTAQQIAQDAMLRKSVLDLVMEDAAALRGNVGVEDQRKLDEYLDSVRELETRIQRASERKEDPNIPPADAPQMKLPDGIPKDYVEHLRLMMDIMVAAFQTDKTRIATFMYSNDTSGRSYPELGVTGGHHDISHHGNNPEKLADLKKINIHHLAQFVYMLEKMKSIPEGKGTLLDNSMIMYGSPISDGDAHNSHNLPILLAGQGGGSIRTGRNLRCEGHTLSNLYLSMLARMGVHVNSFGDSTKMIDALL